ncbi:hypothetical protein [Actinoplanes rectilineatus]|uniref:hypothetical protein n=1 Tax=Actinoplanes rectilineatus TaxID=113571 RepID=UPI0012F89DAB|nr:hypothetical protein [Actinoplanes rectilineatus]
MGIPWRDSAQALTGLLRRHGVDPGHVRDVADFSAPGAERDRAIHAVEQRLTQHPALQSAWKSSPARSCVTLDDAG